MLKVTSDTFISFYNAAVYGDLDTVKQMLAQNPDLIRQREEYGFTALHGVVSEDQPEMAGFLIASGADVNAKNDEGMTPLHLASAEMVALLVKSGADVNAKADGGMTPLHVQAQEGQDTGSLEAMGALLNAGADSNAKDDEGKTAMDYAVSREEDEKVNLLRSRAGK